MGDVIDMSQELLVAGEKSDNELVDKGAELISRQSRNARELGEWWNSIKLGKSDARKAGSDQGHDRTPDQKTAKELLDEANKKRDTGTDELSMNTAKHYGFVVSAFPTVADQRGLSFSACRQLLPVRNKMLAELPEAEAIEKFNRWHYDVSVGVCPETDPDPDYNYHSTNPKPLLGKDIARQIAIATGKLTLPKPEDALPSPVDEALLHLEPVVQEVGLSRPKANKVAKALEREMKAYEKVVENTFIDRVNEAAQAIAEQRTAELKEKWTIAKEASDRAKKKAESEKKIAEARAKRLPMFMTKEEFKLIRGCLRSDRQPEELRKRFDRAGVVFDRLAEGIAW